MRNLIPDRWLYLRVINHPMVASLYRDLPGKPRPPSYIPAENFVGAVLDTIRLKAAQLEGKNPNDYTTALTYSEVRTAVIKCRNAGVSIADGLLPLIDTAEGSFEKAQKNIEAWYDSGMDRVSGWYKRHSRRTLFLIGLIVAVLCNLDTIQITTSFAKSSALRKSLADMATEVVETKRFANVQLDVSNQQVKVAEEKLSQFAQGLNTLETEGLPVGFSCLSMGASQVSQRRLSDIMKGCWHNALNNASGNWLLKIVGWLITALAVSLGAPFWFDLLNRLVDLRGAGPKPEPSANRNS
jgi:hypothetical protein